MTDLSGVYFCWATRATQGLFASAPTILVGLFIAALLRAMVGPAKIQVLFAGEGLRGLVRTSLLAALTPVCALGALPIARELRAAGLPASKVLTFGISAPMLNPITLVYGWTVLPPDVFLLIVGTTLLVSLGIGAIADRWALAANTCNLAEWPQAAWGLRRMGNLAISASRGAFGGALRDLLVCMPVYALVAVLFPMGWIPHMMKFENPTAPLVMCLAAPTAYIDPYQGVVQVAAMASVQFSLGAVVVLHVAGVGLNAAVLLWVARLFGGRRLFSLLIVALAMTLVIGYLANFVLSHPVGPEDDTHALDMLGRPTGGLRQTGWMYRTDVTRDLKPHTIVSLSLLCLLMMSGAAMRMRQTRFFEDTTAAKSDGTNAVWQQAIPGHWLAVLGAIGLFCLLVIMVYVYYPPPEELFDDIVMARADAVSTLRNAPQASDRALAHLDSLVAKLPISMALRGRSETAEARAAIEEVRGLIRTLRSGIHTNESPDLKTGHLLYEASSRCRELHLGDERP